jgi:hypothetical protein
MITKEEIAEAVASFKDDIELPEISIPYEINDILSYTRQQLKSKTKEDLAIAGVQLSQYGMYIKIQMNRLKSTILWCNANIDSIVGRELPATQGYGIKEKSLIIVRNDKDANQLMRLRVFAETKLQSVEDLDKKLEFMAQSIKTLTFNKE